MQLIQLRKVKPGLSFVSLEQFAALPVGLNSEKGRLANTGKLLFLLKDRLESFVSLVNHKYTQIYKKRVTVRTILFRDDCIIKIICNQ